MKNTRRFLAIPVLVLTAALAGCGGSNDTQTGAISGTGSPGNSGNSGTSVEVVSSGVITQFGSVRVNGVRYDTANAQIIRADDGSVLISNPSNSELRQYLGLGQVVTVRGSANDDGSNGVATDVFFDNELVGPVADGSISQVDGTFVVLGQTIAVTPDTIIDDSMIERVLGNDALDDDVRFADIEQATGQVITLDQLLEADMVVEVNGFPTPDGLEATRIEDVDNRDRRNDRSSSSGFRAAEIKGFVRNLEAGQFRLNGLTVFYDESDLDAEDFDGFGLANGDYVEVKGNPLSPTSFEATEIELENDFPGSRGGSSSSSAGGSSSSSAGGSSSSSAGGSSSSSAGGSSSSSAGGSSSSSAGGSSSSSAGGSSSSSAGGSSSSSAGGSSSSSAGGSSSSSAGGSSSSSAGARIEIQGVIFKLRPDTAPSTAGVIVINGLELRVNDLSGFSVGQRVTLKGTLQNGVLVIARVESGDNEASIRIEDQAVSIDSAGAGTRLGINIEFGARTRVDDLGEGNRVEARGFPLNGGVIWTRVKFDDDDDSDCRLRGPVQSVTGSDASDFGFVIQGVGVDVSQISDAGDFRDESEAGIGRQAFFDRLGTGDVVQARSTNSGCALGSLVAREVEFEFDSGFSSSSSAGASSSSSAGASSSSSAGASSSSSAGASSSSSAGASSSSSAGASSSSSAGASSSSSAGASSSSSAGASSSSSAGASSSSSAGASSSSSAGASSSSSAGASSSSSAGASSSSSAGASSSSSAGASSSSSAGASSSSSAGASSSSSAGASSSSSAGASSSSSAGASSSSSAGASSSSSAGASSSSSAGASSSSSAGASSSSSAGASSSSSAGASSSSSAGASSSSSAGAASGPATGSVTSVTGNSFVVSGETIAVNAATLIDNSIIEAARGSNVINDETFGNLTESLVDLLPIGLNVNVSVDRSSGSAVATSIEDL